MAYETVILEQKNNVTYMTLNDPETLNSISELMTEEITSILLDLTKHRKTRALVITGAGRGFCAGANLGPNTLDFDNPDLPINHWVKFGIDSGLNPLSIALTEVPFPTIAAVNGIAAGGGMGLALTCDIVLAARSSKFACVFVPQLGIIPDMGTTWHLPQALGRGRARGHVFTGKPITAEQAEEWGMIWQCVDDAALMPEAERLAASFAEGPSQAYKAARLAMNAAEKHSFAEQLALEANVQYQLTATADFKEGVNSFREKRKPKFTGR